MSELYFHFLLPKGARSNRNAAVLHIFFEKGIPESNSSTLGSTFKGTLSSTLGSEVSNAWPAITRYS